MKFIRHLKASNLLSFGPDGLDLELHDLNVLIGPNGSGKSNFLEVFEILKSLPRNEEDSNNLKYIVNSGGGLSEWIWKGGNKQEALINLTIEIKDTFIPYIEHRFNMDKFGWINKEAIVEIEGKWAKRYIQKMLVLLQC